jgi:hypothetical protein
MLGYTRVMDEYLNWKYMVGLVLIVAFFLLLKAWAII